MCVPVRAHLCNDDALHLSLSHSLPMETPIHVLKEGGEEEEEEDA